MKKNTKDIKNWLYLHRATQANQRVKETETLERSADLENAVYEGLFSKTMTHSPVTGLTEFVKIRELIFALETGEQEDFDILDRATGATRKLANPQAALSSELLGADPEGVAFPTAPALSSREAAAEMIEVYEKNILREKSFSLISSNTADTDLDRAVANLNSFGDDFTGPKDGGVVTRKTLFRGKGAGELVGPYISQLMYLDVPLGNHTIVQRGPTKTGVYGITAANWKAIQEGSVPVAQTIDSAEKYMWNPAQLGSFVHIDFVYQAFLYAAAIMASNGAGTHSAFPTLAKEGNFVTNGGIAEIASVIGEVSRHALKASWVQKWRKNLRIRPETMAGRVVLQSGTVHPDLLSSSTIAAVKAANVAAGGDNEAWLPIQYAEGSPTHPSYPAGHAAIAGACATMLKLYFADGAWSSLGQSVVESLDGTALNAYANTDNDESEMTIHGEINKLASNMSIGRNMAGVHYRSDGDQGLVLGEKVAIQCFKDIRSLYNESKGTITITGFGGNEIVVE